MRPRLLGGAAFFLVVIAVCALVAVHGHRHDRRSTGGGVTDPVTLSQAIAVSKRLGAVASTTPVRLVISLRSPHQQELERLFLNGEGGSPGAARSLLAPSPALVEKALAIARRAGFTTSWKAGDGLASLRGPARSVAALFGVRLSRYEAPGGREFYAGDRNAVLPAAFRPVVTGIAGLDDFTLLQPAAIPRAGASPTDAIKFYDVTPLRAAGLDGSGETIVFPEAISPNLFPQLRKNLAAYSAAFGLPAADLTVQYQRSWAPFSSGDSATSALGEADLDVEVVHAIAPGARLIVYLEGAYAPGWIAAQSAMIKAHPTAIVSDSYGNCELTLLKSPALENAMEQPWLALAAENMTAYVSSGDSGAYDCGESQGPVVDFPASTPVVAGVGGTTAFFGPGGSYGKEIAWGEALTGWASGGGVSRLYARPSWQHGAGFPSTKSAPGRLVPDVSSIACSCWDIHDTGETDLGGGTSAAAPFWAAVTALIDEKLVKDGLRPVGIPNRALAWIAQHQSTYGAFHDVVGGNNLLYDAVTGWDAATGFGTPDVAKLEVAWTAYIKGGGK
jgi:kumamolisin